MSTDARLLGFVAGLTLPLTVSTTIIVYAMMTGVPNRIGPVKSLAWSGIVLYGAAVIASLAGLGLPIKEPLVQDYIPAPAKPLFMALGMYLSSYGLPLMIASIVIGVALAMQIVMWVARSGEAVSLSAMVGGGELRRDRAETPAGAQTPDDEPNGLKLGQSAQPEAGRLKRKRAPTQKRAPTKRKGRGK